MKKIDIKVDSGHIDSTLRDSILQTFGKRIESIPDQSVSATIVVNPILVNYDTSELISGNTQRFLIDDDQLIDEQTRIRLATMYSDRQDLSFLFIFNKNKSPLSLSSDLSESILPNHQKKELAVLSGIINRQKGLTSKNYNSFCISGESGNGKTSFVELLAIQTSCKIWKLTYGDIDAENTGLIKRNTDSFFKSVKSDDIVFIENVDSFLCGKDANHYVKNSILSAIRSKHDVFYIYETIDPSQFDIELQKLISRYIYIKPNTEEDRNMYLQYFLHQNGLNEVKLGDFVGFNTSGLSVRDLKDTAFITSVIQDNYTSIHDSLLNALDQIQESKMHSSISSHDSFVAKKPKYSIEDLILPADKIQTIKYAMSLIKNIPLVYDEWHFSKIDPHPRSIINFYGKPGTGKTMAAHAIAYSLHKDLLALNYAEIESKYIGDAPKKLESAFAYARQHDVVMFFDEADSFLGKRIENVTHSADQALNSLRSTMLIQLEMFEGVVIFASNLKENYDKAFKSRFLYEIEFDLPDRDCRKSMLSKYIEKILTLSNANYSDEQINELVTISDGLSGRELKSAVLESLNQYAYSESIDIAEKAALPFDIVKQCFVDKVNIVNSNVKSNSIAEDKKLIGEKIVEQQEDGNV